ncbi:MAG: MGMT family protein [Carbonactinosporaceae bacterium]
MESSRAGEPPPYVEVVLDVIDQIPPGRVMSYGDVAEYAGSGGPRQVGWVMARYGGAVAWWRVLRADGSPPLGHEARALARYRAEGTPLRRGGDRVDMGRARWDGRSPSCSGDPRTPGTISRSMRQESADLSVRRDLM